MIEVLLGTLAGAACSVSGMVTCFFIQRSNQRRSDPYGLRRHGELFGAGLNSSPEPGTIRLKGDHPADSIADQVRRRQWPLA